MKAIGFMVEDDYHTLVKLRAFTQGKTVKEYVTGLIDKDIQEEKEEAYRNPAKNAQ